MQNYAMRFDMLMKTDFISFPFLNQLCLSTAAVVAVMTVIINTTMPPLFMGGLCDETF